MRRRLLDGVPGALAAAITLALWAPLLDPRAMLVTRDIPFLHLPLRTVFADLARFGLPQWNPLVHGGQPILSNPHYAAFYPLTWLSLLVPPYLAINLLILFHAAWAFTGAWLLARRLGGGRHARALAALGFAGGGSFVSLAGLLLVFTGMAWLPWILLAADAALAPPSHRRLRAVALLALAFALQILNGDPASVTISLLALLFWAASGVRDAPGGGRLRRLGRLAAPIALGLAMSSVQLLPTLVRLADSRRGHGLPFAEATVWSSPPARFVELLLPHFYGDVTRDEEGLYFGWNLHDKDYPLLLSIYPGGLVAVLGLAALLFGPVPRRSAWVAMAATGVFLGLGRHNPLYSLAAHTLPGLEMLRYPEKYLLLSLLPLPFAGALLWERLLDRPPSGALVRGVPTPRRTLWLGLAVLLAAATWLAVLLAAPGSLAGFLRAHSGGPLPPPALARALSYLRSEASLSLATFAAVVVLLVAVLRRPDWGRLLTLAALLLLAADLWSTGHRFNPTLPAADVLGPPPLARAAQAASGRVFSTVPFDDRPEIGIRRGPRPGFSQMLGRMARLDPYAGTLWGVGYALSKDYDLMATSWARLGDRAIRTVWAEPEAAWRLLGAWNVGRSIVRKSPEELRAELAAREREPTPARLVANPDLLPRYRFVPAVRAFRDGAAALAAARQAGEPFGHTSFVVRPAAAETSPVEPFDPDARIRSVQERGGEITVEYQAAGRAFLVAAVTYDGGWEATADGSPIDLDPTAIGAIGVAVPAGRHRLELRYRDPWLPAGGALSAIGVLATLLVLLRSRSPFGAPGPPPS